MASATRIRRIAVMTGGGDAPGLNAVIGVVVRAAILDHGWEVLGIEDGYLGLIENRTRVLHVSDTSGILRLGGTILGTTNKVSPSSYPQGTTPEGKPITRDMRDVCLRHIRENKIDALIVIGGDGTMAASTPIFEAGINVIGVPKTIDNDIVGTELTFGFLSAVDVATDALDRVYTTAASHARLIVVEVMGRNAGWIALYSGIASASDVILLPEIPFDLDRLAEFVISRRRSDQRGIIVCASEGARQQGGEQIVDRVDPTSPDPIRLGGVGRFVADQIESRTGIESRCTILGHIQRGGAPVAADRILGTQLGYHAIRLLASGATRRMVVMQSGRLTDIEIEASASGQRLVPLDHHLIAAARSVGTCFGD